MKFTDGNWMMRKGVRAFYAGQAYEVETLPDALVVQVPAKRIHNRGNTLDGPLLTVRYSSPLLDVICVQVTHFGGEREASPQFPLLAGGAAGVTVSADKEFATLASGNLAVKVARGEGWGVEFVGNGNTITKSGQKGLGLAEVEGNGPYLHEQLALGVGECVYGLGERFTAFVKNGQVVETWNRDGGTGSEQAYKNVPFYLTNRGYGVFVNHPEDVSFEVASEKVSRVQFSVRGQTLDYFVIYGPTPKEVLAKYTRPDRQACPTARVVVRAVADNLVYHKL